MRTRSVCIVLLLIPVTLSAQSRSSRNSSSQNTIPGVYTRDAASAQALKKRLEEAIDKRRDTQKKAVSEARKLLKKYQSDRAATDADKLAAKAGFLYAFGGDGKSADAAFEQLQQSHPDSLWNYEGQLCRFDIAAEQRLDLPAMKEIINALVPWTQSPIPDNGPASGAVTAGQNTVSPLRELPIQYPGPPIVRVTEVEQRSSASIAADILHRAALVSWLEGDGEKGKDLFQRAIQFDPKLGNHIAPLGLAVIRKTQFRHSPVNFQDRTNEINRLILLADVYANSSQVYRTNLLWENILKQHKKDLSKEQRSYVEMTRSLSIFNLTSPLEKDPKRIIEGYLASQKLDPTSPWADKALYLAGNAAWNLNHDHEQAIALYQKQLDQYPERYLAPHAAYRTGIAYEYLKKWKEAKQAYDLVLEKYPDSGFTKLVNDHLRKLPRN